MRNPHSSLRKSLLGRTYCKCAAFFTDTSIQELGAHARAKELGLGSQSENKVSSNSETYCPFTLLMHACCIPNFKELSFSNLKIFLGPLVTTFIMSGQYPHYVLSIAYYLALPPQSDI